MSAEIETLHKPFAKHLRTAGIPFTYHDPSRPTGATLGDADFLIHNSGRCLHVEFKDKDTRISASQTKRHAELAAAGCTVHVIRNLDAAIELVQAWLGSVAPDATERMALRRFGNAIIADRGNGHWDHIRQATEADKHIPQIQL